MVGLLPESQLLRLIVALPLLAALFHAVMLVLVRRESQRGVVILVSCGAVLASFLVSVWALFELLNLPEGRRILVDNLYTWIGAGYFSAELAFQLDPLSAVMVLVVTGVGSLIHIYSIGYMDDDHRDDKGYQRFFCYMNLFTFSMLVLVLADNLVLMFLGWEGVGLCSYLLIGFWYSDRSNAYCGSKAFIVNRIGDFGFLVGILLLFFTLLQAAAPSLAFRDIAANLDAITAHTVALPAALSFLPGAPEWQLATLIGLCLFVGACGKSAQIPLYVWLPDAMAGPTPVSALIHAATMVTAGVYMVCRMSFLYEVAPGASAVIAWTGALTAILAATIAISQTDIKKVLAYSTVSQLGYMFLAAGCGGYAAAMFHLGTHAFFKALLFLGAGAVILAMHHEQDTDKMGGLWRRLRVTWIVFGVGVVAIAGVPPLSGFFSKDEILLAAYTADQIPGHGTLYRIGLATAVLTAFYMFRLFFRTFHGSCRAPRELRDQIREPADTVLVPLYVLALLSTFAGFAGLPQVWGDMIGVQDSNSLKLFLAPVLAAGQGHHEISHAAEIQLALRTVGAAALGFAGAWLLYLQSPGLPKRLRSVFSGAQHVLVNKYYVDELYDLALVRPLVALSDRVLFRGIDAGVIDGVGVNGAGRSVRDLAAQVLKRLQSGFAQGYIFMMIVGAVAIVGYLVR